MKFFLLGVVAAFIISVIYDWEGSVQAFKEGSSAGQNFLCKSN
ncbi:hypothetical protein [Salinimicrobium terrae]|nr:hypothetical protein [Salinimicrobium terrae]